MIAVRCYQHDGVDEIDPVDISELVGQDGRLLWVDLVNPSDEDLTRVAEEFALHPLAMEDARKHKQRPKLEQYPTHAFVVAYSSRLAEVDLFVGPTWLVSVRGCNEEGEAWEVDAVRRRFERTRAENATVGFLLYTILDELVDGYFVAMDEREVEIEGIEERIFDEEPRVEHEIQSELFAVRRRLLEFRRAVAPLREVVASLLRREVAWIDSATIVHLQDVYDHILRVLDVLDSERELMGNAVDAHLAIMSNRMNLVMKRMTSWGAILLGATLVAGIYGMNFQHMPELGWQLGYPMALAMMATITVVGYIYFSRKDWL